jgi:hypothetical protein
MNMQLLLTILTIIIATFVAFVGYLQFKLANEKFKLDLFEKRFAIYKEVESFLLKNMPNITSEETLNFFYNTKDAVFLFEDDIADYLNEIFKNALELEKIRIENPSAPFPQKYNELSKWFRDQLAAKPSPLIEKFSPYLKFKTWKEPAIGGPVAAIKCLCQRLIAK